MAGKKSRNGKRQTAKFNDTTRHFRRGEDRVNANIKKNVFRVNFHEKIDL
jgi:hypothetical protein